MSDTTAGPRNWVVTLGSMAVKRNDGTSSCKVPGGREGDHHFVPNRDRTAFVCSHDCGTRASSQPTPEAPNV